MDVEIAGYALDRVPLSIILDDSTLLLNLNYFFIRDRNLAYGENRRWQDVTMVHRESFTREMARVEVNDNKVELDLTVWAPELTLHFTDVEVAEISVDGRPLAKAGKRADFRSGTFWREGMGTYAAFDPQAARVGIEVQVGG